MPHHVAANNMKEAGRAHPFDPRHDAFHELNTTAMLLREIVQIV